MRFKVVLDTQDTCVNPVTHVTWLEQIITENEGGSLTLWKVSLESIFIEIYWSDINVRVSV